MAHRFRCSRKEVRPILKCRILGSNQPQPCFMHKRRGLERLFMSFLSHLKSSESPQFIVHNFEKLVGRLGMAVFSLAQNLYGIVHHYTQRLRYLLRIIGHYGLFKAALVVDPGLIN
jgi:hypothetical protein